ncbi:MAG: peptide chain release factor N(5)-glutamine methyltransferase [Bacteroidales bacterium]|jgi:release factor glutamine methyltransferase|nr:peptide chain release factor N(5)-glutamine methyltransferase [Bacteroidales bacterium]
MNIKEIQQSIFLQLSPSMGTNEAHAVTGLLLKHFTSYDSLYINLYPETEIDTNTIACIDEAIRQLLVDKPVQYILGETFFCDLPFFVDASVLIPRPETEELTCWAIKDNPHTNKLIDICTGSGCIAISLANYIKNSTVYAIDISADALETARKNALLNKVNVNFIQYDVLHTDFSNMLDVKFDVVISNPPYVRKKEKQYMHKRVLDYEPEQALFVEDDNPLSFYHAILKFGQTHLVNEGKLYVEINEIYGEEVVVLYEKYGYADIDLRQDIHGKDRMLCGTMKL